MKNLLTSEIGKYRCEDKDVVDYYGSVGDETCGVFVVRSPTDHAHLMIIASSDGGWDHVSISRKNRCPNWTEMEYVAKLFFEDDEIAVQYHLPPDKHINEHPYCLHWWRPQEAPIPLPPVIFV